MRSLVDRAFLLFAFIQLGLEYQSIYLFLWPLNHSCAKPPSSQLDQTQTPAQRQTTTTTTIAAHGHQASADYAFNDSRKNSVNPDAIQTTLFDAYPDDPFTSARALSMGIKYDDIAGCLQYRREFDTKANSSTSIIDLNQLETCPHGLRFEASSRTTSVVPFFELACSRQYLTILLPHSFALGLFLGIILTAYYLIMRVGEHHHHQNNGQTAQCVQLSARSTITPTTTTATRSRPSSSATKTQPANLYYWFLIQLIAGLIIQIQTYSLSKFISAAGIDDPDHDHGESGEQHPNLYGRFVCCILLRSFIAASNLTRIVYFWKLPLNPHELLRNNHRDFLLFSAIYICFKALYGPVALKLVSSWWRLNEGLALFSFCFTVAVFTRESIANHQNKIRCSTQSQSTERGATNQLVEEGQLDISADDWPGELDMEFQRCEFCSLDESPINTVDNPYAPTTTSQQPHVMANVNGARTHHMGSFAQQANRSLTIQLVLLTFCLSFDYFLFQMLPDHKLLHSETTASRLKRKLSFAEEMSREVKPEDSHSYSLLESITKSDHNVTGVPADHLILHDQVTYMNHPSQLAQREFDFRSKNRATQLADAMENSSNPIELLWTSAKLNKWPLDLVVFLLHLNRVSNFESVYFKLSRLFVPVELGAKFLALEWLVIGIFKRQNHLLEWDWLYTICVLLARTISALMLFNYVNLMLKLNDRLSTNRLMLFLPNTLSAVLAFWFASYAPLLERLDLVIIPISLILVNLFVLWLTRNLSERFRASLCPMIFEDQRQTNDRRPRSAQRMVLVEPTDAQA